MTTSVSVDVAVVGGGIAGLATAWWVAQAGASVVVLEREPQSGLHATGRSAGTLSETSGHPIVCALTSASRPFFEQPPVGFTYEALIHDKGMVWIGRHDDAAVLDDIATVGRMVRTSVQRLDPAEARSLLPGVSAGALAGGAVHEPDAASLDVAATVDCFIRGLRPQGGQVITSAEVIFGLRRRGRWVLDLGGDRVDATVVVNAAGAWGDVVAERCGVPPLGLRPLHRTAAVVDVPAERQQVAGTWPLVMDVAGRGYFEPVDDGLLISLGDEQPSSPCDARAHPDDVTRAVQQVGEMIGSPLGAVQRSWAGLRTFTRDRLPAVGSDPLAEGFVWLVGQGGAGIKAAPALGALAAAAALGAPPPALAGSVPGLDVSALDPGRFSGRRPPALAPRP